ncbi:hypothetical protein FB45DRAFT_932836 [Roridomyces roridus]|uniref:F-box domain-containing protein n=1 Tax=Roridomyces roridus TaxID=1738132 RepID=A0AAD7BDA0_9AGAR|nr:hypothetical protein FB45DRAFT_932836 [Roridomyces roridus]
MHSPFARLLQRNFVPSERERHQIRDLLDDSRGELATLTGEITHLQSLLDAASKKRDEVQDFMDAHTALLSPARRLPDDIVQAIFLASLPETRNSAIVPQESPLLVSQICSAWRNIALSTPRLWASIYIVVPGQDKLDRFMEQLALWVFRSGAVPLSISLRFSNTAFSPLSCDFTPLLNVLVGEARRWGHIEAILPQDIAATLIPMLSAGDLPVLQSMVFRTTGFLYISPASLSLQQPYPALSFLATTSLHSLTIPTHSSALQSPISWSTLRHLSIEQGGGWHNPLGITHAVALTILLQCSSLESCKLSLVRGPAETTGAPVSSSIPYFTLPHLTDLTLLINVQAPADQTRFFRHATLPALRSLHCQGGLDEGPSQHQSFFPDDPSSLESLTMDVQRFPRDVFYEALSQMRALLHLYITREPVVSAVPPTLTPYSAAPTEGTPQPVDLITHLTIPEPTPSTNLVVCPLLRSLKITRFSRRPRDTDIIQFVQSRTRRSFPHGVAPLEEFSCVLGHQVGDSIATQLQEEVDAGFKLSVVYKPGRRRSYLPVVYSPLEGTI